MDKHKLQRKDLKAENWPEGVGEGKPVLEKLEG